MGKRWCRGLGQHIGVLRALEEAESGLIASSGPSIGASLRHLFALVELDDL